MYSIRSLLNLPNTPKPLIMGILNATPDSFSNDGTLSINDLCDRGQMFLDEGAVVLDVGGESSRPFASIVPETDEIARVVPLIEKLRKRTELPISIDTCKPRTAAAAIHAGANVINDISGFTHPEMLELASETGVEIVIMHMQGTPETMQIAPHYNNVISDIMLFFQERLISARSHRIPQDRIILDPGIGFGKNLTQNVTILRQLSVFRSLECPILIGPSRKSFIGQILNVEIQDRLEGTLASLATAMIHGVDLVRVHDVRSVARFRQVFSILHPNLRDQAITNAGNTL